MDLRTNIDVRTYQSFGMAFLKPSLVKSADGSIVENEKLAQEIFDKVLFNNKKNDKIIRRGLGQLINEQAYNENYDIRFVANTQSPELSKIQVVSRFNRSKPVVDSHSIGAYYNYRFKRPSGTFYRKMPPVKEFFRYIKAVITNYITDMVNPKRSLPHALQEADRVATERNLAVSYADKL